MVSNGNTTPETKSIKLPVEMEANVPVSSDLNIYPRPMPMKEKTEDESNNAPATGSSCNGLIFRKMMETPKMITTCIKVITMVVR